MSIYVAFSDEDKSTINSVFSCLQDTTSFPYQAALESNDSRYKTFYDALPPDFQKYLVSPTTSSTTTDSTTTDTTTSS